jgi:hypothetical protein
VTRLGEFSPVGWLVFFGQFLKVPKWAKFWATFFQRKNFVLILMKIWWKIWWKFYEIGWKNLMKIIEKF